MHRQVSVLLGGLALVSSTSSFAAVTIDSFESGPFSASIVTQGVHVSSQTPSLGHCVAEQRKVSLDWNGDLGSQMSASLVPLQNVDDAAVVTFGEGGFGTCAFEYDGGPWDLTEVGSNNRFSVRAANGGGPGYAVVQIRVRDVNGDVGLVSQPISVTGTYQIPFSAFASNISFTAIENVVVTVGGDGDRTVRLQDVSVTSGAEFSLLYDVWQPTTFYACGPNRGGGNTVSWNWRLGPQTVAGTQVLVTGVGGQSCEGVTFHAADSGGGLGSPGAMVNIVVDWGGNSFDSGAFEMHYAMDPSAPYDVLLVGDPVVEWSQAGFVVRHQVQLDDVPNAPDGTATQQFVVTPYPGQEIYFDYVEAIPLPLQDGGYSLSFGITGAVFDAGLPLLEMYTTGGFEGDGEPTSVIATPGAGETPVLRCVPSVSRTTSTLELARPSDTPSSVDVFDVSGRLVRRLALGAGSRSVDWDGRSSSGAPVGSGVYHARWIDTSGASAAARVIRLR